MIITIIRIGTTRVPITRNRRIPTSNSPFEGSQKGAPPQVIRNLAGVGDPLEEISPRRTINDALQNTLVPPPVGARLALFKQAWEEITSDSWTLNIIRKGYLPEFKSHLRPKLSLQPERFESARNPQKSIQLQGCVDQLLEKKAIVRVETMSPSLYSNVFIVPKKNGQFRLVINLRQLNQLLLIPHFKMESSASLIRTLQQGEWATSIDLSDAYLHVPMRESFQHLLRFVVNGKVYQYRSLPFGLSTAPLVFTKICQPLAEIFTGTA